MFTATHIPTGTAVEIQDTMKDNNGEDMFYVQSHDINGLCGWTRIDLLEFHN